jgi:hypothetical protein
VVFWACTGRGGQWCHSAGARRVRQVSFWKDAGGQTCRDGRTVLSSHVDTQVFDSGGGIVTGKRERERVATPVRCWGGVELACVNERWGESVG